MQTQYVEALSVALTVPVGQTRQAVAPAPAEYVPPVSAAPIHAKQAEVPVTSL